jgi:delta-aminolevulinic acid dehydratase/porphobilinogen synthase
MQLLQTLAAAAASSATAGLHVPPSSFMTGAIRELSAALVKGNEAMYREALHVFATAGSTPVATVPTVDPE